MRKLFTAITLVLISAATALSQTTDPMAAVRQYIDSFNKGDLKGITAACANANRRDLDGRTAQV
jgi:hypothetical protein